MSIYYNYFSINKLEYFEFYKLTYEDLGWYLFLPILILSLVVIMYKAYNFEHMREGMVESSRLNNFEFYYRLLLTLLTSLFIGLVLKDISLFLIYFFINYIAFVCITFNNVAYENYMEFKKI